MAVSTCEGSTAPLEQAAPLETAKPRRSSAITIASPSMKSKRMLLVPERRAAPLPLTAACGTRSRIPRSSLSRSAGFSASSREASSAARAERRRARHVLRPRTPVALVVPAVQDPLEACALAHVERPYALRRVELVRGHGVEVYAQRFHIHRDLAQRLHAVAVHRHASLARDARDFRHRLQRAQLVVRVHHGDQHGVRAQRAAHIAGVHHPLGRGRQVGYFNTFAFQLGASVEHRRMLDGGRDDVAARPCGRACDPEDGQVVRLRAAAGEDDLPRIAADQPGNLPPRPLQPLLRRLPEIVDAGGVTIHFETRHQGLHHFWGNGGGGIVVEVKPLHLLTILNKCAL